MFEIHETVGRKEQDLNHYQRCVALVRQVQAGFNLPLQLGKPVKERSDTDKSLQALSTRRLERHVNPEGFEDRIIFKERSVSLYSILYRYRK